MRILITGGAGFIGTHVTDELIAAGHEVRVLDNLDPQVHSISAVRPQHLHPDAELLVGDVRDEDAVAMALQGIDAVFHLAAAVGVGQSMYQIRHYVGANDLATATLLEALTRRPVRRLVVASSMSIYGEGLMRDSTGRLHETASRSDIQLKAGNWELSDHEGRRLEPCPTPEWKRPSLRSVYAVCKHTQEQLCLSTCPAYGIQPVALRFFNVFGPRQALSNPYTGVLAIFASRLLNGRPPVIYEDGEQRRDFVHVRDVARACRLALETDGIGGGIFNIGSGASVSVREIAATLIEVMGETGIEPEITGKVRVGDIRHCFADGRRAAEALGFEAQVPLVEGIEELADWVAGEVAVDRLEAANRELARRGLVA